MASRRRAQPLGSMADFIHALDTDAQLLVLAAMSLWDAVALRRASARHADVLRVLAPALLVLHPDVPARARAVWHAAKDDEAAVDAWTWLRTAAFVVGPTATKRAWRTCQLLARLLPLIEAPMANFVLALWSTADLDAPITAADVRMLTRRPMRQTFMGQLLNTEPAPVAAEVVAAWALRYGHSTLFRSRGITLGVLLFTLDALLVTDATADDVWRVLDPRDIKTILLALRLLSQLPAPVVVTPVHAALLDAVVAARAYETHTADFMDTCAKWIVPRGVGALSVVAAALLDTARVAMPRLLDVVEARLEMIHRDLSSLGSDPLLVAALLTHTAPMTLHERFAVWQRLGASATLAVVLGLPDTWRKRLLGSDVRAQ